MFEIGNSLREARLRQGLDIPRIESETKIRGKYLRALEDEGFEMLPGDTYVKGFLRTYADYLGLDGQLYVDEFNSRFSTVEEPVAAPSAAARRRLPRRSESNLVVVALAGIVAVTVLVVVGLAGVGSDPPPAETPLPGASPTQTTTQNEGEGEDAAGESEAEGPEEPAAGPAAGSQKPRARLVLTAERGSCWMQVRAGGVKGRLLYEGTLEQGQTQRFLKQRRLWVELGAPANLDVKLNGRAVADFPTGPAVVSVTAAGVRTLSTG